MLSTSKKSFKASSANKTMFACLSNVPVETSLLTSPSGVDTAKAQYPLLVHLPDKRQESERSHDCSRCEVQLEESASARTGDARLGDAIRRVKGLSRMRRKAFDDRRRGPSIQHGTSYKRNDISIRERKRTCSSQNRPLTTPHMPPATRDCRP